jgi:predicted PurR-regulated permease PerM
MAAGIVVVVGALYVGSDILIPLALAILLSFMLAPLVIKLRRLGLSRIPAVVAVVLLLFLALLGLGAIVASQVVNLADNLPRYEWNLRSKIRDLRIAIPSGGVVERTSEMLRDLGQELEEATAPAETASTSSGCPTRSCGDCSRPSCGSFPTSDR